MDDKMLEVVVFEQNGSVEKNLPCLKAETGK